jgi:beta-phosphoglucomutase-like phosphatase (HAD superfamily)
MIIFDFDQTLVDTRPVESLRAARRWREVMAAAPRLVVYDGINELLKSMHKLGQTLAIVTKSPDMVPKAFIRQHKWPIDIIVGYHQVTNRKPDHEGFLLVM